MTSHDPTGEAKDYTHTVGVNPADPIHHITDMSASLPNNTDEHAGSPLHNTYRVSKCHAEPMYFRWSLLSARTNLTRLRGRE